MADGHRLLIFEDFEVDRTLPKHQADRSAKADVELAGGIVPVEDELGDLTVDKVADHLGRDPSLTLSPDDFLGDEPRPESQA